MNWESAKNTAINTKQIVSACKNTLFTKYKKSKHEYIQRKKKIDGKSGRREQNMVEPKLVYR